MNILKMFAAMLRDTKQEVLKRPSTGARKRKNPHRTKWSCTTGPARSRARRKRKARSRMARASRRINRGRR